MARENEYSTVPVEKINKIKAPRYTNGVKSAEELLGRRGAPNDRRMHLVGITL